MECNKTLQNDIRWKNRNIIFHRIAMGIVNVADFLWSLRPIVFKPIIISRNNTIILRFRMILKGLQID